MSMAIYDHCFLRRASGNVLWFLQSTVGWTAGVNVPVVVLFDLGQEASLSSLLFNTTGGGNAGVHEAGIRVFVSLDDQSYVLAGERPGLR
jgi:hypothetical protein